MRDEDKAHGPRPVGLIQYLTENAGRYYPELDSPPVRVTLRGVRRRSYSVIYRFTLEAGDRRRPIVVKVRRPLNGSTDLGQAVPRPRVVPLRADAAALEHEHAALSAIHAHFTRQEDARFDAVRILDLLDEHQALVMDELRQPTLSRAMLRGNRLQHRSAGPMLRRSFRHTGAWLRRFHQLPPLPHTRDLPSSRAQFVATIFGLSDYLGGLLPARKLLHDAVMRAADALSEKWPLATGHGDFAPRNVFVGDNERITVIDTIALWRVPISQDIGCFLVAMNASRPQVYTQGGWCPAAVRRAWESEFLQGYFGDAEVPMQTIRLHELQALLDRWASTIHDPPRPTGLRRGAQPLRLMLLNRFFRRYLASLLAELR
ncbi:MAG: hypothetical protein ACREJB_02340 [Planctomycetaceae bacterium]